MAQPLDDRSRGRRLLGLLAIVVGLLGALTLWFVAGKRYDDAVEALAPAPVGCDTTLAFDRTGTFTFFVETVGRVDAIEGDCATDERSYDLGDAETPSVELNLVDGDGDEVELERAGDATTYDRGGAVGAAISTAEIGSEGDYILTVTSDRDDVMVRVGGDPARGVTALRVGAGAVLLVGLGLGIVALVTARSGPFTPGGPAIGNPGQWLPRPGPPPIAPPYANPPVPPPYGAARPPSSPFPPPTVPPR